MLSCFLIVAINFNYSWNSRPGFWHVNSHKSLSISLFIYNKKPFQVWFKDDDNDDDEDDDYDDDDEDDYDDDDYDDDHDDEDDDDYDGDYDGDDVQCWRPPLPSTSQGKDPKTS